MRIAFVASECAPFIKSGGLGDVAAALPKALSERTGNEVSVFVPYYSFVKYSKKYNTEQVAEMTVKLGWRECYAGVFRLKSRSRKIRYYFIDNEYYFNREPIYGHYDDGERYAFFSKAVLEAISVLGLDPEVIHCNDWQTACIIPLVKSDPARFGNVRTVFTIHNVEYQGIAGEDFPQEVLGLDGSFSSLFDFDGCSNMMKAAIVACDKLTTVSESYAGELQDKYFSKGLSTLIRENSYKLSGIINGIDMKTFDPAADPVIPFNYSADDLKGKKQCKKALQKELGLLERPDVPMIAIVSRLVGHKGLELFERVMREIAEMDIQLVVLGTGDPRFEGMFRALSYLYPDKISVNLKFSVTLASKIYAASDFLLMPSKSEPCGLAQMIAMRYGTLPVVHATGGLKDTVAPVNPYEKTGQGFTFRSYNAHDMLDAIRRAVEFYYDKPGMRTVMKRDMTCDFSWHIGAEKYMNLYKSMF